MSQPNIPDVPTNFKAIVSDKTVGLSWTAPNDGGSEILYYTIVRDISNDISVNAVDTSYNDTGLTNGTQYSYTITATNAVGTSSSSSILYATPSTIVFSNDILTDAGLTVGANVDKSMYIGSYYYNYGGVVFYPENNSYLFPSLSTLTSSNIVLGDKVEGTKDFGRVWGSWNGLFSPVFGWFYLYDVETSSYYMLLLETPSEADSVISTQVVNAFERTFTINYGYPVQGIFKIDISVNDNKSFRFGGYGLMGTTNYDVSGNLTYQKPNTTLTLHYNTVYNTSNPSVNASFYFVPRLLSDNSTQTYSVNYDKSSVSNPEALSVLSNEITQGLLVYISSNNNVKEWVANDLVAQTPPGVLTNFQAVNSDQTVSLSWTALSNGGSEILYYTITKTGFSDISVNGVDTSYNDTDVVNGTTYYYTITATNAIGTSSISNQISAIPGFAPDTPTNLQATGGDQFVALTWTAPVSSGTFRLLYYTITKTGFPDISVNAVDTSYNDTDVVNGTTYYYTITAINAVGTSSASTQITRIPGIVPDAPSTLQAIGGVGVQSVTLTWTAPVSSGTLEILYYTIVRDLSNDISVNALEISYNDTNVVYGTTYSYTIKAVSAIGPSLSSDPESATPSGPPEVPTNFQATNGNQQILLSWTAPFNGGSEILYYTIAKTGFSDISVNGIDTSYNDTGLTNGTSYYYTITATNAIGTSLVSTQITGTPVSRPDEPTNFKAIVSDKTVGLSWTAPINNGSSEILYYTIIRDISNDISVNAIDTSYNDTGLINGTQYSYKITATNAIGTSLSSSILYATPSTIVFSNDILTDAGLTVGANVGDKSMYIGSQIYNDFDPNDYPYLFPNLSSFTNSNIILGDKIIETKNLGTVWVNAFGDGLFGIFGWYYLYDVETQKYYIILISPQNLDDGVITTQVVNAFDRTFTIKYGYPVQGIFKFDISVNDNKPFRFGAYGLMGSYDISNNLTYQKYNSNLTLHYNTLYRKNYPYINASFYFVPRLWTENNTQTYSVNYDLSSNQTYSSSALSVLSNETTQGLLMYISYSNNVNEWVVNDLNTPPIPPAVPTNFQAVNSDQTVALSWTAPLNGGSEILYYTIAKTGFSDISVNGIDTSYNDTDVVNGTQYSYTITATNAIGTSSISNQISGIPAVLPDVPTNLQAIGRYQSVALTWTAPVSSGTFALLYYTITKTGFPDISVNAVDTSYNDTGLTNGTTYTYTIKAISVAGSSESTGSVSAIPAEVPGVPTNFYASGNNQYVILNWTAPYNNWSEILYYTIVRDGSNDISVNAVVTSYNDIGLINGTTYSYTITATNAIGTSSSSNSILATPSVLVFSNNILTDEGLTVGANISDKSIYIGLYYYNYAGTSFYPENNPYLFPSLPTLTSSNIVLGDKTEETKDLANVWGPGWNLFYPVFGWFYLYDVETSSYYMILLETPTEADGVISTQVVIAFGRTFTIKYGYPVQGIFKIDISVNDNKPFRFGEYGLIGSNDYDVSGNLTYQKPNSELTLHYNTIYDQNNPSVNVSFYFVPKLLSDNSTQTYSVNYDKNSSSNPNAVSVVSNEITKGLLVYMAYSNNVNEWVANDINVQLATPGVPTNFQAVNSDQTVSLSWTAPDNGGSKILYYTIAKTDFSDISVNGVDTSYNDTDVVNGRKYYYTITATNAIGTSSASTQINSIPGVVPDAPTNLQATGGVGVQSVALTWTAPVNSGTLEILYYIIVRDLSNDISVNAVDTSYNDTNVVYGTTYSYTIKAVSAIGSSSSISSDPATPVGPPTAPINFLASGIVGAIELTWGAPLSDGGSAILYYTISRAGISDISLNASARSYTEYGLINGTTYTYSITATNSLLLTSPTTGAFTKPTTGGGIGDPHIVTIYGKKYDLPHTESCFLLYDNQDENDRVIITSKNWKLPKDILSKNRYLQYKFSNATYFKYLNIYYKGENLTIDMETLQPVSYTNKFDMEKYKLKSTHFNNGNIKLLDVYDDKYVFEYSYKFPKLIKFKKLNVDIKFAGKSRNIKINSNNPFTIKISYDLNCFDTRNEIKIIDGIHNYCTGAFIYESEDNSIDYLVPFSN